MKVLPRPSASGWTYNVRFLDRLLFNSISYCTGSVNCDWKLTINMQTLRGLIVKARPECSQCTCEKRQGFIWNLQSGFVLTSYGANKAEACCLDNWCYPVCSKPQKGEAVVHVDLQAVSKMWKVWLVHIAERSRRKLATFTSVYLLANDSR